MASLKELIAQREALEIEIERTRATARGEALDQIRALMDEYGLTAADLGSRPSAKRAQRPASNNGRGSKVAAKYRDASTGETWSGRGLQPKWLKAALAGGRTLQDFAV